MMGRLFCIVCAMISYLFWNICSCPRSEIRHGWCGMIASVFLRLWPQAHLQAWTDMATTCGTTLANPWSHITNCSLPVPNCPTADTWIYRVVLLLPPKKKLGCVVLEILLEGKAQLCSFFALLPFLWDTGLSFFLGPNPSFLGWRHSGLLALLRSLEPDLAVTHSVYNLSFSPWLWSARG